MYLKTEVCITLRESVIDPTCLSIGPLPPAACGQISVNSWYDLNSRSFNWEFYLHEGQICLVSKILHIVKSVF
jgi:hypothetical protein